ncbi:hypothetical protein E4U60_006706 [Claviceps pazoutovae]|uniref:Uncharacterized protein n=1 Tax=Claviceps pazoutovae TaxID=1649127 RepID=A0A9P7MGQ9_9HYPO|nr:hypothetical protein E4U60_006706 [Claviceps pazoutovae]
MTGGISTIFSTLGGREAGRLPFRPTAWKLSPLCVHRSFQTSFCQRLKNDVVSKASFFPKSLESDNTASENRASRSQEIDWGSELRTRERTPLPKDVKDPFVKKIKYVLSKDKSLPISALETMPKFSKQERRNLRNYAKLTKQKERKGVKLEKLLSQAKVKEMKAKRFAADAKELYDRYERMKEAKRLYDGWKEEIAREAAAKGDATMEGGTGATPETSSSSSAMPSSADQNSENGGPLKPNAAIVVVKSESTVAQ